MFGIARAVFAGERARRLGLAAIHHEIPGHDAGGEEVEMLLRQLEPLSDRPVIDGKIGAVIGVYSGPGVIGVALRKA